MSAKFNLDCRRLKLKFVISSRKNAFKFVKCRPASPNDMQKLHMFAILLDDVVYYIIVASLQPSIS